MRRPEIPIFSSFQGSRLVIDPLRDPSPGLRRRRAPARDVPHTPTRSRDDDDDRPSERAYDARERVRSTERADDAKRSERAQVQRLPPSRRRGDQGKEEPRPRATSHLGERRGDFPRRRVQLQGVDGTFYSHVDATARRPEGMTSARARAIPTKEHAPSGGCVPA
jgi:hypothetical protein